MRFFERIFPGTEVREALAAVDKLEGSVSESFGLDLGFDLIKAKLRKYISGSAEGLRKAKAESTYTIEMLTLFAARNIVIEELASGKHVIMGGMTSISGNGLVSLHNHLTSLLEKMGAVTKEEAKEARTDLREMMSERFG